MTFEQLRKNKTTTIRTARKSLFSWFESTVPLQVLLEMISTNQQVNELGSEFPSFSESFDTGPTNLSELSKDSYLITSVHARFLYMSSPFVCPCMLLCIHIFSNCTYTTNQILKHFKLKQKPQKMSKNTSIKAFGWFTSRTSVLRPGLKLALPLIID